MSAVVTVEHLYRRCVVVSIELCSVIIKSPVVFVSGEALFTGCGDDERRIHGSHGDGGTRERQAGKVLLWADFYGGCRKQRPDKRGFAHRDGGGQPKGALSACWSKQHG